MQNIHIPSLSENGPNYVQQLHIVRRALMLTQSSPLGHLCIQMGGIGIICVRLNNTYEVVSPL